MLDRDFQTKWRVFIFISCRTNSIDFVEMLTKYTTDYEDDETQHWIEQTTETPFYEMLKAYILSKHYSNGLCFCRYISHPFAGFLKDQSTQKFNASNDVFACLLPKSNCNLSVCVRRWMNTTKQLFVLVVSKHFERLRFAIASLSRKNGVE